MIASKSRIALTPEEVAEHDEFLAQDYLRMNGSISRGIPWDKFSEFEIQAILKIHFERLGFEVIWRHKEDAVNEGGVDLECKKARNTVLVAVKKKPKKEAIGQVHELSRIQADQRIYVYIGGAAQSFRDSLVDFAEKVDFCNEKTLEEMLSESGLTLILRADNSLANQAMLAIMKVIVKTINSKPALGRLHKPSSRVMETVWGMKDRSVTLQECAGMAMLMFEDSQRIGSRTYGQVQDLLLWCLDHIYANSLLSLRHTFEALEPELKRIFYRVHKTTRVRSNWFELLSYHPGLIPGWVDLSLEKFEKAREEGQEIERIIKSMTDKQELPEPETPKLDEAVRELRGLFIWSHGLECTVDDLFERCVKGRVRR